MKKQEIWKKACENLRNRMPVRAFETWFSQANLIHADAHEVILEVPNKFIAAWIQEHYLPQAREAFQPLFSCEPNLRITYPTPCKIAPSKNHPSQPGPRSHSAPSAPNLAPTAQFAFSQLVVGEHNRLAYSCALEVARRPGSVYNPLLLWGNQCCGKTHLLFAISHFLRESGNHSRVAYLGAKGLSEKVRSDAASGNLPDLKRKLAACDVLLFDDMHEISGKSRTQDIFTWLFDALWSHKKQIVIASRTLPRDIPDLIPPLQSRLTWGLVAEIGAPDHQIKVDIVKKIARKQGFSLPEDVAFYLAGRSDDVKVLLEDLVRLQANDSIYHSNLDISMVKAFLEDAPAARNPAIDDILRATAAHFHISLADMLSSKKTRAFSYPRHLAMYLCRKHTGNPLKEIGRAFGRKDHSTVIYAVNRIDSQRREDPNVQRDLRHLELQIESGGSLNVEGHSKKS